MVLHHDQRTTVHAFSACNSGIWQLFIFCLFLFSQRSNPPCIGCLDPLAFKCVGVYIVDGMSGVWIIELGTCALVTCGLT
jgi:hypothetical protein